MPDRHDKTRQDKTSNNCCPVVPDVRQGDVTAIRRPARYGCVGPEMDGGMDGWGRGAGD